MAVELTKSATPGPVNVPLDAVTGPLKFPVEEKIEAEFGDVMFSLINYARFNNINPEDALEKTNKKFIKRFQYLESKAAKSGKLLSDMTLAEMDVYWNEAKQL